jgi:class 3 adenylate cyclase/tetratricopeptide (TPR) repeat protein
MTTDMATAIVGRDVELAELRAGLLDAFERRGRLFLIVGEAGIGKTRLSDQIAIEAKHQNATVLWGRCWDGGNAPAYWPWIQVFRSIAHTANRPQLEELHAAVHAGQVIPDICETFGIKAEGKSFSPADPELDRFRSFDSTLDLLRRFARSQPTVVILDDLHAADMTSLLMLRVLARELRDTHLFLIGTYRQAEVNQAPERAQLLADIAREGATLQLGGLNETEVARFVALTAKIQPKESMVSSLKNATGGNPFFLGEILRLLAKDGSFSSRTSLTLRELGIPEGVRDSIRKRLDFIPKQAREVLTIASVIGREFDLNLLSAASQVRLLELIVISDSAVQLGLLTLSEDAQRYSFAHDLIRETIYREIAAARRIELHRAIGAAMKDIYSPVPENRMAELAYHSCESTLGAEIDEAIGYARQASSIAKANLAYEEAARLLDMALRVLDTNASPDDLARCDLLLDMADVLNHAGILAPAKRASLRALEIAGRLDSAERLARGAIESGRRRSDSSVVDWELVRILETAAVKLGDANIPLKAEVLARLANELYWAGPPARVKSLADEAVSIARGLGDIATLMSALWSRHESSWSPDNLAERLADSTEALALAKQIGDWDLALEISYSRIGDLLEMGDIKSVDSAISDYSRITAQHGGRAIRLEELRAMRVLLDGRIGEAEECIQKALEEGQRTERPATLISFAAQMGLLRYEQGRMAELEEPTKILMAQYPNLQVARLGLIHSYIQGGRLPAAQAELEALADSDFASIPKDFNWLAAMCGLSDATSSLRHKEVAKTLYSLLLPYAGRNAVMGGDVACYGSVARFLGELTIVLDRFDEAEKHLEQSIIFNRKLGARGALAHSEYHYAELLAKRGSPEDRERALELLNKAISTTEPLGIMMIHAKAVLLRDSLQPPGGDTEQRPDHLPAGIAVFTKEGDYWTIGAPGAVFRIKDMKGLAYLAHLFRHPGVEFHSLELAAGGDPGESGKAGFEETLGPQAAGARARQLASDGLRHGALGDAGELLDPQAKAAYRRRLEELRAELEEASQLGKTEHGAKVQEEIDALARELGRAVGSFGRDRRAASSSERARLSVTRALRAAIEKIGENESSLGRFLAKTVRTGTFCSYVPYTAPPAPARSVPARQPSPDRLDAMAEAAVAEPRELRAHSAPDGTVTLLFSDVEDSSPLFERLGDLRAQDIVRAHNEIIREQINLHKGFEVKSLGDGFMIAFSSARRALLCAIGIQRAFAAYCDEHTDQPIRVRIGLHVGETISESADFFGKAVILAARIAARARGGEILVSSTMRDLTETAGDLRFTEAGDTQLKGFPGTHRLYRVIW